MTIGGFLQHPVLRGIVADALYALADEQRESVITFHDGAKDFDRLIADEGRHIVLSPVFPMMLGQNTRYEYVFIKKVPLRVWLNESNSLSSNDTVSLEQLSEQFCSFGSQGFAHFEAFIRYLFASRGLPLQIGPKITHEFTHRYAQDEYAITIDLEANSQHGEDLRCKILSPEVPIDLCLIAKADHMSPVVRAIFQLLSSNVRKYNVE